MKTLAENMKDNEGKKRELEEKMDTLNEELATLRAQGENEFDTRQTGSTPQPFLYSQHQDHPFTLSTGGEWGRH